jgi:hypothetical protein
MSKTTLLALIRCLLFGICLGLPAQPPSTFDQKLREVRFDLRIEGGKLAGSAAPVLEKAISGAQYVLIGEDHMTREIPQFATAVCDAMAPQGLTAMAVEAGPQAAKMVASSLGKTDRLSRMAALTDQYPDSVAFLNVREENDLAEHCAEASHNPNFQLWGLDQELMGAGGWLLDQILATRPGTAATVVLTRMKTEEQKDAALAKETGDPTKVFLFAASDAQLSEVAAVLKREGNAAANELVHELIVSHEIYLKNMQGSPESNSQRARLLKQHFRRDFRLGQLHRRNGRWTRSLVTPHLHPWRQGHTHALWRLQSTGQAGAVRHGGRRRLPLVEARGGQSGPRRMDPVRPSQPAFSKARNR